MEGNISAAVDGAIQSLPPWQRFLAIVGCALLASRAIQVGGDRLIRQVTPKIPGDVDEAVLRTVHPPIYVTVVLVGLYLGSLTLTDTPATADALRAGTLTLVTVTWAVQFVRLGRRVSKEVTRDDRYDTQLVPIFENVWTAVNLGGGTLLVLSYWEVDVTPLLASAGILGIVVGLAARDTIANFFGSIALYADGTYTVGDYIILESGQRGRVEDVSIRSTVIRTRQDMLVTVPNSELNTAIVVNESTPDRERRVDVEVGVAYGSDVDHVEEVLLDVADEEELVLDSPEPRVRFRAFGDSALEFQLRAWIPAPVLRERAVHRLNKAVYKAFQNEGVDIPFPQRVVSVADDGAPDEPTALGDVMDRPSNADSLDDTVAAEQLHDGDERE